MPEEVLSCQAVCHSDGFEMQLIRENGEYKRVLYYIPSVLGNNGSWYFVKRIPQLVYINYLRNKEADLVKMELELQ